MSIAPHDHGRIVRLEMLLCAIYLKLPKFIKDGLGEDIAELIERIGQDLVEENRGISLDTQRNVYGLKKQ